MRNFASRALPSPSVGRISDAGSGEWAAPSRWVCMRASFPPTLTTRWVASLGSPARRVATMFVVSVLLLGLTFLSRDRHKQGASS